MPKLLMNVVIAIVLLNGCSGPIYTTYKTPPEGKDNISLLSYFTKVESKLFLSITAPDTNDELKGGKKSQKPMPGPFKYQYMFPSYEDYIESVESTPIPAVTVGVVHFPNNRRYLFLNNSLWFNNTVEFSTNVLGLPSKSDTNSTQQLTGILNMLGQTASQLAIMAKSGMGALIEEEDFRKQCYNAIGNVAPKDMPFYRELSIESIEMDLKGLNETLYMLAKSDTVKLDMTVEKNDLFEPEQDEDEEEEEVEERNGSFDGFIAYEPSSIRVSLSCISQKNTNVRIPFGSPQVLSVYNRD